MFNCYVVSSVAVTEFDIKVDDQTFITPKTYSDGEIDSLFIAKLDSQIIMWKIQYEIEIDKYNFWDKTSKDYELTIENAVIKEDRVIGFIFHGQYFALSDVNKKRTPKYVPQDILDIPAYKLYVDIYLKPSGLEIKDGYIVRGTKCVGVYYPLIGSVTLPDWITSIETGAFKNNNSLTSVCIPGNVKEIHYEAFDTCINLESVVICKGVEKVSYGSFLNCTNLSLIRAHPDIELTGTPEILPFSSQFITDYVDGVTYSGEKMISYDSSCVDVHILPGTKKIAYSFFKDAETLNNIIIPEGVTHIESHAFQNCVNLVNVVFPKSLISIGDNAFYGCTSLETVYVSGEIQKIGKSAFKNCSSLQSVEIEGNNIIVENEAFYACENIRNLILHYGIVELGSWAFSKNTSLSEITIPGSLKCIPISVFKYCSSLKKVVIQDGVERILADAFAECISLVDFIYPETVRHCEHTAFWNTPYYEKIENYTDGVFYIGCSAIKIDPNCTEIVIKDGVDRINDGLIRKCDFLKTIHMPESIVDIGCSDFSRMHNLENIYFSKRLRVIGSSAFEKCTSLRNVSVPGNIWDIADGAFNKCTGLLEFVMVSDNSDLENDFFSTIGRYAFFDCINLKRVVLSDNVSYIADYAFANCNSLAYIYIPNPETDIAINAFDKCDPSLVIECLPDSKVEEFSKKIGLKIKYITKPGNL